MKKSLFLLASAFFCLCINSQSLNQIRSKADSGDAYSQYLMGWSYANGANGLRPDYNQALPWFKKASNNGYAAAAYFLGWMYYYG